MDSADSPVAVHRLRSIRHRHLHCLGTEAARRVGELCAAGPARPAHVHRPVHVRAALHHQEEIAVKIKLTRIYVSDQEKALRFYTDVLGFVKKADFSQGPFRWLTVASAEEPEGTQLQLALNDNPAARAYQQAIFEQKQPAAMFYVD